MCKFNPKNDSRRIDPCMKNFIGVLQLALKDNHKIVASCCGHGKYPMTIVAKVKWKHSKEGIFDLVSGEEIPRKKKFYKKDKQGVYYIPETIQSNQRICECSHKEWDEHKSSFYNYKGLKMAAQECNVKNCRCKKFKPLRIAPKKNYAIQGISEGEKNGK